MKKSAIVKSLGVAKAALKKYSPQLLTGIGIAGMIATTVTAVRATPKALRLIDEREIQENKRLTTAEVIKTTWKCYLPAAVTGTLSVACLIGANSVSLKRHAALATAYTLSETALKEYQEKTVEVVGEKKEQAIRDAVAKDKLVSNPVDDKQIVMTGSGETLCYDVLSGRYFKSDIEKIRKAINDLNRDMLSEQYVSLNDLYYAIGLPDIKLGEALGWNIDKGYIDVQFGTHLAANGTPCLVLAFNVAPQYGYNILSLS